MKAYKGDGKTVVEIPAEFKAAADEARAKLVEAAAEGDDTLLEKYLESGELSDEEVIKGLDQGRSLLRIYSVLVAAGSTEIGVLTLAGCDR